jgi:hypothetical protein
MSQSVQEIAFALKVARMHAMRMAHVANHARGRGATSEQIQARKYKEFLKKCKQASILHLVDLKRAGHSPRRTEYHIPTERPIPLRNYATHGSICGSPGAMCQEEGSKAGALVT